MQCPVCPETTLLMSDRQGVEIDYCPKCRGVWLDRGELDKLIQLSGSHEAAAPVETPRPAPPAQAPYPQARRDFDDSDFGKRQHGGYYPKRKSWLSDFFD